MMDVGGLVDKLDKMFHDEVWPRQQSRVCVRNRSSCLPASEINKNVGKNDINGLGGDDCADRCLVSELVCPDHYVMGAPRISI